MKPLTGSLRGRLVVTAALTTLLVMTAAAGIAVWQVRSVTGNALTDAVRTRLAAVRDGLSPTGALGSSIRVQRTATYVQVLDANGRVVAASPALRGAPPLVPLAQARAGIRRPRLLNLNQPDLDLAALAEPQPVNGRTGAIVVAVESQGFLDARQQLQNVVLFGVPLVVLLIAALTWLVTGRALRTVTQLAEEADALSVSDSGRGLSTETRDAEINRLVSALNRMLTRLSTHYATNLAAAAETTHRLRTPLAAMRAEAELALLDDDPDGARTALERIVGDTDRLTALVDRLLLAAGGHADIRPADVAFAEIGADWQRLAATDTRSMDIRCDATGSIDATLLRTVVDPLVENAIRHGERPDPLTVEVTGDDRGMRISVTNGGTGVPPELRETLFQPWAGRPNGGLGLWLAREAARASGGDVWCADYGPPRTQFIARLPCVAVDAPPEIDETTPP